MKTVYFVCTANICRSPMAAGLLRNRLAQLGLADQIRVESAGVHALPGHAASAYAQSVLSARGISLEDHRSQPVTYDMLANGDMFLVMEESHRRSLFHLEPRFLGKVFLLSEMSGDHADVVDPFGKPETRYGETASVLEKLIEAGLPSILKRLGIAMPRVSNLSSKAG